MGDKETNARELLTQLIDAFPDLKPHRCEWIGEHEMALYYFSAYPKAELQIADEVFRKSNPEIVAALQKNDLVQAIQDYAGCYRLSEVNDDLVLLIATPFPPRS